MSISKPGVKIPWGRDATTDVIEPPDGLKQSGWTNTSAAPPYQYENWIMKRAHDIGTYLMARGIPDHDGTESYTVGDVVQVASSGAVYRCVQACDGTQSMLDTDYWVVFGTTDNWLATALTAALSSLLPAASAFVVAMLEQLGIAVHVQEDGTSHLTSGYLRLHGLQINFCEMTFGKSGGYPVSTAVTWGNGPAAGCTAFDTDGSYGVLAQPRYNNVFTSVATHSATACTINPQTIVGASFPGDVNAFIVAFGKTPSS